MAASPEMLAKLRRSALRNGVYSAGWLRLPTGHADADYVLVEGGRFVSLQLHVPRHYAALDKALQLPRKATPENLVVLASIIMLHRAENP